MVKYSFVWCDCNGSDKKVHTWIEYLTVMRPQSVTAQGLLEVVESELQGLRKSQLGTERSL